jgi:hypothetical protein
VQQLEHVVEHRRVGAVGVDDGEDLLQVVAEEPRRHLALARVHPVDVAAERVDLAVVRDVAVGVGARPGREGVRREARVHHGDRRRHLRVEQVRVVLPQLARVQHPLVDDGAKREAGDVEVAPARHVGAGDRLLRHPPGDVELALERHVVGQPRVAPDEDLPDHRHAGARGCTQGGVVERDVAPAEDRETLGTHGGLELADAEVAAGRVLGQEDHAGGIPAGGGQLEAELAGLLGEEGVGRLEQDPGAVAGVLLGSGGPAVLQVEQHLDRLDDDGVRPSALDVHDEPEAAAVVLVLGVVEALLLGVSRVHRRCRPSTARVEILPSFRMPTLPYYPAPPLGARAPSSGRAAARGRLRVASGNGGRPATIRVPSRPSDMGSVTFLDPDAPGQARPTCAHPCPPRALRAGASGRLRAGVPASADGHPLRHARGLGWAATFPPGRCSSWTTG